jgi:hypothetical protein
MMDEQTIQTAYHEAGHCTMAVALGRRINYVATYARPGSCGRTRFADIEDAVWSDDVRPWAISQAQVAIAGPVATARFVAGERWDGSWDWSSSGGRHDVEAAVKVLDMLEDGPDVLERVVHHTRRLMRRPDFWGGVTRVAEALGPRPNLLLDTWVKPLVQLGDPGLFALETPIRGNGRRKEGVAHVSE